MTAALAAGLVALALAAADGVADPVETVLDDEGRKRAEGPMRDGRRHGLWRSFAEGGAVTGECPYVDGEREGLCVELEKGAVVRETGWFHGWRHGPYRATFRAGLPSVQHQEGSFRDDLPDGRWVTTHDGHREEGSHRLGKREGVWVRTSRGAVTEETYVAGKLHGPSSSRGADGKLRAIGEHRDGVKSGTWTEFHPGGERSGEGAFVRGERHGQWTEWDARGNEAAKGTYRAGRRHGGWVLRTPSGGREEGQFTDGEKAGVWTTWDREGVKGEEATWRRGKRNGPGRRWNRGELVEEGSWAEDRRHGRFVIRGGPRTEEGAFAGGEKSGPWVERDRTGRKIAEGAYVAGRKEGDWRHLDERGGVDRLERFESGALVAGWKPSESGSPDDFATYLPLEGVRGDVRETRLAGDDDGNRLLVWAGERPKGMHAQLVGPDRKPRWTAALSPSQGRAPAVEFWPGHGFVVAFAAGKAPAVHLLPADGSRPWGETGAPVGSVEGEASEVSVIQADERSIVVVWREGRGRGGAARYRAQRLDATGRPMWPTPVAFGEGAATGTFTGEGPPLKPGPGGTVRVFLREGLRTCGMAPPSTRLGLVLHPDGRVEHERGDALTR